SNALTLFIVILVGIAGVVAWGQRQYTGPGPLEEAMCFRVERGDSLTRVSERLAQEGAIDSSRIFRIGADYEEKAGSLKFGSYLIPAGASMQEVVETITRGGQSTCGTEVNYQIGV